MIGLAKKNAMAIAAGHSFILFLGEGFFPVIIIAETTIIEQTSLDSNPTPTNKLTKGTSTTEGRDLVNSIQGSMVIHIL